jgi:hypothetical protein
VASEKKVCAACGDVRTAVDIAVGDRTVTMESCNGCDRRWWSADGAPVDPLEVFGRKTA